MAACVINCRRHTPFLRDLHDPAPARWPRVSMVIPACNEEQTVESAVHSRLLDEYPDLEVVMVDDRSTDGTGAVIDHLAASDARIVPLHITDLSPNWLGKIYAMQRGFERSSGEWILFTDADVHAAPGCLRTAVARCEAQSLDVLAVIPEFQHTGLILDATIAQFLRTIMVTLRPWQAENPRSSAGAAAGAFTLVRRSTLERSPGLAWLKLELGDDIALGQMLKASGARCAIVMGKGMLEVLFYPTLHAMAVGAERAGFTTIGHFSLLYIVVAMLLYGAMEYAPYVLLGFWHMPVLQLAGMALVIVAQATCISLGKWAGERTIASVMQPVGAAVNGLLMLRAGILGTIRGGVWWRGTFYSSSLLRGGRRARFW
ncbi:MAG: glycosyltransferase family 2 protein [Candidatus Cryosericum sp.]